MKFNKAIFRKSVVVVEIGYDWLKILENSFFPSGRKITKIKLIKLADIKKPIGIAIAEIFKDLNLEKRSVVTYLPRHLLTVRILEFPSIDPLEINDMVSLQVGRQTPYSKEEIMFTHKQIANSRREGFSNVMLIIARQKLLSDRMAVLQEAGVEVDRVGIGSEGVLHWFNATCEKHSESASLFAVLDIDSSCSDFVVIYNKELVFTRNILIGANHLVEASHDLRDKFIGEIKHSIDLYRQDKGGEKITKLFLVGASINIEGIEQSINNNLDIVIQTLNSFENIRIEADKNILKEKDFKTVSVCSLVGIALKHKELEFDLTPVDLRIKRMMEIKRKQLVIMGVLVLFIVMVFSLFVLTYFSYKKTYLAQMAQRISMIKKSADEVERMRKGISLVKKRMDNRGASVDILDEITRLLTDEICLTVINIMERDKCTLKGQAQAMSNVFTFVTVLESSPLFENVKTVYTSTRKDKDGEYVEFEIVCNYEGDNQ